ncbi:MAG TPA: cytochrome c oxidase subunit II [bacterium]|nr:cytochrome c oxidase subunit II [bacterium]
MIPIDRYEKRWLAATGITLVVFVLAIAVTGFVVGVQLPSTAQRVNPIRVSEQGPFATPGVRQLAPGRYDAYVIAPGMWTFYPNVIRIPQGSTVTFHLTSQDVQHGFYVEGTNVHMMVLPGQVSELTTTFRKAGEYHFWCDEYCGLNHHTMSGRIIVEPKR